MTIKRLIFMLICFVAGCSTTAPDTHKSKDEIGRKPDEKVTLPAASKASSLTAYKRELAQRIYQANANNIYTDRPQALLRSVIVLTYQINSDGKLLHSEILRTNHDKTAEKIALSSLRNATPFPKPPSHLLRSAKLDVTETWLFNDDGRFQLRTIALPQRDD